MPSPVPFHKVRKRLKQAGWTLDRIHGSHHIFIREGSPNLVVPVHRNEVRAVYVRQIEKAIEEARRQNREGD